MLSIVTISYNQRRYLPKCLGSVAGARGASSLEHICVDPGSTDGSREILEAATIDKLILEPDSGPADGLNKGFSQASGDILGFVNADDELLPGVADYVTHYFASNPGVDVLLSSGYIIDEESALVKSVRSSRFTARDYVFGAVTLLQQGMFFRRDIYEKVGGFNTDNRTCWDGELVLEMVLAGGKAQQENTRTGAFRIYADSITGSGRLEEQARQDRARLFARVMGRAPRATDVPERYMRRASKILRERDRLWLS